MNDATMERLQCQPKGDTAGRKGQDRKGPRKRQLLAQGQGGRKVWGKREGCYEGGRMSADPSNPSQACLPGLGEGGSRRLPLMASWSACLCADQPLGPMSITGRVPALFFVLNKAREASASLVYPSRAASSLPSLFAGGNLQPHFRQICAWKCPKKSCTLGPSYVRLA